ncbi:RNA polymerase sigma-70 factor, ECF subfamily [Catalinimonas alkaloidigena]|uniref:RNA polymerase sigma-70 factor, ECF subfamily n=1 Tax=Catalinimonas alkaloidigena TaxID=1075417 RepID=A0A1G9KVR4_9BACT|nr:sigma-70 family RNA polymerase sigma factor [Catalinimonas alkaloidigena]SDL53644.1 RNA polymerase sigma-70 factor, ECF subfamily [Catalinimonas alkaloidigena]
MKLRFTRTDRQYTHEKELVQDCQAGVRAAQRHLYEHYAPKMLVVCQRYLRDDYEAEDALVRGFTKVFQHLHQYEGNGSFEGWIRRIMVNEALMQLRKSRLMFVHTEVEALQYQPDYRTVDTSLEAEDLMNLVCQLPDGYRTVFNLYAIEGYSHKEIADQLGISESTSKSQLSRARVLLQEYLRKSDLYSKKKASHARES